MVLLSDSNDSQRFCVDFCALNFITKRTLLHAVFSHHDLFRENWQIDVAEKDQEKPAFATPGGLYQFRQLSFGLTNALACFLCVMHRFLKGLCWSDCLVYLDNIYLFGEHYRNIGRGCHLASQVCLSEAG